MLFGLQMVLAYACMLLVMTYDTLIATATILGLVVGYFINLVGCWPMLILRSVEQNNPMAVAGWCDVARSDGGLVVVILLLMLVPVCVCAMQMLRARDSEATGPLKLGEVSGQTDRQGREGTEVDGKPDEYCSRGRERET